MERTWATRIAAEVEEGEVAQRAARGSGRKFRSVLRRLRMMVCEGGRGVLILALRVLCALVCLFLGVMVGMEVATSSGDARRERGESRGVGWRGRDAN